MATKSKLEQLSDLPPLDKRIVVALAGLALWQLKRLQDRNQDGPEDPPPAPRPLVETLEDGVLSIYPSSNFHEGGQPVGITVSSVAGTEGSITVSGEIDELGNFVPEENSEADPSKLQMLRQKIGEARRKIENRASEAQ